MSDVPVHRASEIWQGNVHDIFDVLTTVQGRILGILKLMLDKVW